MAATTILVGAVALAAYTFAIQLPVSVCTALGFTCTSGAAIEQLQAPRRF